MVSSSPTDKGLLWLVVVPLNDLEDVTAAVLWALATLETMPPNADRQNKKTKCLFRLILFSFELFLTST